MNPRQRRGLLLLAIAGLGLLGVFVLVAGYVADVRAEVDPKVRLLALAEPLEPYEAITDEMVTTVEMPERWAPKAALRDRGDLIGLVAASPLGKDSILQRGMLVPPPELGPGEREVAILVDAETGVAGKVGPGASVDIVATFEAEDRRPAESRVVVPGARIVEVGNAQLAGGGGLREREVDPEQVVPVTFALTQDDALEVTYAESFATEVRLALLRPDEDSGAEADETFYERERRTRRAGT